MTTKNFYAPTSVFNGVLQCQTAPSGNTDVVRKQDVAGLSFITGIASGSSSMLSVSGGELSVSNLLISDVTVNTTRADLAAFVSNEYSNGNEFQKGDIIVLTAANGDPTFIHNGGTDSSVADWTQIGTASSVSGGNGISVSGSNQVTVRLKANGGIEFNSAELQLKFDDGIFDIPTSGGDAGKLQVKASGITNAMLAGSIAASKLSGSIPDSKLSQIATTDKVAGSAVQLAGSGGLENDSGLKIAATGVTNAMLAGSIDESKLAGGIPDGKLGTIATANKVALTAIDLDGATDVGGALAATDLIMIDDGANGTMRKSAVSRIGEFLAGDGLAVASGVLAVGVDDASVEINSDALRVKASGITNDMLAGSIANGKLANSTISGKALGSNLDALAVDDSSIEYSTGSAFNGSAASTIRVKASGITDAMLAGSISAGKLAGSIPDSKLSTIATAGKVSAAAITLANNPGLEVAGGSGLQLKIPAGAGLERQASGLKIKRFVDSDADFSANTTKHFDHNLGQRMVHVTVVDSNYHVIDAHITLTSENRVSITVSDAITDAKVMVSL